MWQKLLPIDLFAEHRKYSIECDFECRLLWSGQFLQFLDLFAGAKFGEIASTLEQTSCKKMQTKKRISGRNASREHASPRVSRAQKKASENAQVADKKVPELITSSARKQKCGILLPFYVLVNACLDRTQYVDVCVEMVLNCQF